MSLDDITGLPYLMMAQIYLLQKDHAKALAEAERALLARPGCDGSYVAKANVLNYLGRPAESVELAKYAPRLTPVYPVYYAAVLAAAYYGAADAMMMRLSLPATSSKATGTTWMPC
jgi:tetratricopeptide (TPR) repeat protein